MSQRTTIIRGRIFNERLMTSTCIIERVTSKSLNPASLRNEDSKQLIYGDPDNPTDLEKGKCKIRIAAASAGIQEREPIGQQIAMQERVLSLPVAGTELVRKNDIVTILTNPDDEGLVGHTFRIKGFGTQTSATARRFSVEEAS